MDIILGTKSGAPWKLFTKIEIQNTLKFVFKYRKNHIDTKFSVEITRGGVFDFHSQTFNLKIAMFIVVSEASRMDFAKSNKLKYT